MVYSNAIFEQMQEGIEPKENQKKFYKQNIPRVFLLYMSPLMQQDSPINFPTFILSFGNKNGVKKAMG
jgi:hypothetical protein